MIVEIYPLEKVVIDKHTIPFGMNKEHVEAEIGKGELVDDRYYYFDSEMVIDYKDNKVEFIEFLGGIDGEIHPNIYGVSGFDIFADELLEVLEKNNNGEVDDSEQGYSYAFVNISVGIYREITPDDVTEMIEEMKSEGILIDDNEDIKEEIRRANHWMTIGAGRKGYYNQEK